MEATWQVQQAKNRFSELIEKARVDGPQIVTHHGKPVVKVVAISIAESRANLPLDGFTEHLLSAPSVGHIETPPRNSRRLPIKLGK